MSSHPSLKRITYNCYKTIDSSSFEELLGVDLMRSGDLILETASVRLRRVRVDDAPSFFSLLQDVPVIQYIGIEIPPSVEKTRHYIEELLKKWRTGKAMAFALCQLNTSTQEIVGGLASLDEINYRDAKGELGIWIGKHFWGTGMANTGLTLLLQVAFLTLDLRRVFARAAVENVRMHKRLESLGFEREGILRKDAEIHGEPHDMVLYAILKENYLHLK